MLKKWPFFIFWYIFSTFFSTFLHFLCIFHPFFVFKTYFYPSQEWSRPSCRMVCPDPVPMPAGYVRSNVTNLLECVAWLRHQTINQSTESFHAWIFNQPSHFPSQSAKSSKIPWKMGENPWRNYGKNPMEKLPKKIFIQSSINQSNHFQLFLRNLTDATFSFWRKDHIITSSHHHIHMRRTCAMMDWGTRILG